MYIYTHIYNMYKFDQEIDSVSNFESFKNLTRAKNYICLKILSNLLVGYTPCLFRITFRYLDRFAPTYRRAILQHLSLHITAESDLIQVNYRSNSPLR